MLSKVAELFTRYARVFSAISEEERKEILNATVGEEVQYLLPTLEGSGHEIILKDAHNLQAKWPGAQFVLHGVSEHHDVALIEWQLVLADGTPSVRGYDFVRLTPDGKFAELTAFAPLASEKPTA